MTKQERIDQIEKQLSSFDLEIARLKYRYFVDLSPEKYFNIYISYLSEEGSVKLKFKNIDAPLDFLLEVCEIFSRNFPYPLGSCA
jgi:hypothetical protein